MVQSQYEELPGCCCDFLAWLSNMVLVPDRKEAGRTRPPRSDGSIGGKKDLRVGGPDRSRGWAEQGGGEWGLRLKERRRHRVRGVAVAVREGVADGGRHRRQVGGNDLGGQGLTLVVLGQGELNLLDEYIKNIEKR